MDQNTSVGKVGRSTSIVCTIGPASEAKPKLRKVLEAGMNIMRLNLSHGDHEEQGARIRNLREIMAERRAARLSKIGFGQDVAAIAMDLKGPEIRTGTIEGSDYTKAAIEAGQRFKLHTDEAMRSKGSGEGVFVDHAPLADAVKPGDSVFVDDAELELEVVGSAGGVIECVARNSATLGGKKGVNVPGVDLKELPVILDKDHRDLKWAVEQELDMVFASFIRSAQDVREIREVLAQAGPHGEHMLVIAKMETQQCVNPDTMDEILQEADGLMVARGDLAIEVPYQMVPMLQERMVERAREYGKPAIVATQLLASMTKAPRPTRAEANDVYVAVQQGATATMTSGETANGKYPTESVRTMEELCVASEDTLLTRVTHFERTLFSDALAEEYGMASDDEDEGEGEGDEAHAEAKEARAEAKELYEALVKAHDLIPFDSEDNMARSFVVAGSVDIARNLGALGPDFTVVVPMAKGEGTAAAQLMLYKGVAPFINAGEEDSEWGLLYDPQGNVDFGARFAAALCESGLAMPDGRKVIVVAPKGPDGKGVKCVEVQLGEAEEEPVED